LAFRDDFFARPIDCQSQAQISYEDQIGDLRAQIDGMSRRDQERAEEIKIAPAATGDVRASHLGVSERSVDSSNPSTKRFACYRVDVGAVTH
jgi:hypothetical protein